MHQYLEKFDLNLLIRIHNLTQNQIFDVIMPYITALGNNGIIWIIISLLLFATKKYRSVGIMCFGAFALSTILSEEVIKHIVQRYRPFTVLTDANLLIEKPTSYSFPSGHSTIAFATAGIIFVEIKKLRYYALILASTIAFSRIYLQVHYPLDVLGGVFLGIMCTMTILLLKKVIVKVIQNLGWNYKQNV